MMDEVRLKTESDRPSSRLAHKRDRLGSHGSMTFYSKRSISPSRIATIDPLETAKKRTLKKIILYSFS